jgi:hypothetical protein
MKEEWLLPGAVVPVTPETVVALINEIKRLIDMVGDMALVQHRPSGSYVAWNNTLCNPLAPAEKQNLNAWEDGFASGVKAEREECAKVCEAWGRWIGDGQLVATAIRARGNNAS